MAFIHNFLLLLLPSICLLEFRGSAAGTDLLSRRYWSIFSLPLRWGSHFLTLPRSHLCCPKRYSWGHETTSNISTLFFQNHFPPPFFKTQKEDQTQTTKLFEANQKLDFARVCDALHRIFVTCSRRNFKLDWFSAAFTVLCEWSKVRSILHVQLHEFFGMENKHTIGQLESLFSTFCVLLIGKLPLSSNVKNWPFTVQVYKQV